MTMLCTEYPAYTVKRLMHTPIQTIQVMAREMERRAEAAKRQ